MNYLDKVYNLDWQKYNDLVYNSISFKYFPEEEFKIETITPVDILYELEEEKIIYIPISKNASTSITNSLNFRPITTFVPPNSKFYVDYIDIPEKYRNGYKFLVVTRDPKKRWISGINEFLNERSDFDEDDIRSYDKFIVELKNNKFIFDCHTRPQFSWINFCFKYDLDITFLRLDENLNEKISNVLGREVIINHYNPIEKYESKIKIYNFCYNILTKYCMKNKNFLDLHEMDFYLYNNSL